MLTHVKRMRKVVTWTLVQRSAKGAMVLVGVSETFMAIAGFSLADMLPDSVGWPIRLLVFALAFLILSTIIAVISYLRSKNGLQVEVGGNDVEIKVGDLFAEDGLKLIPFDEWFDIQVDDKVISRNSLNGIFIEQYADGTLLRRSVTRQDETTLSAPDKVNGRYRYPLGTIKPYDGSYALLAFTHMDNLNRAHLSRGQYEECLLNMWCELNRVYAGKRVVLPLLGSGITRYEGSEPTRDELLQCMLCTLRASRQNFRDGIEIVLTRKTANHMRLHEVREYTDGWNQGKGEKDGI
jgi:hypothetical protein